MKALRRHLPAVYYSLPVQLFFRQLHQHKMLLVFWLLLIGLMSGWIGQKFGGAYLFLEPEYLGREDFWSLFIVGSALGGFLFAYTITLLINESYRFHFIAKHKSPFYILAWNNFIIPGSFLMVYFWRFWHYHVELEGQVSTAVIEKSLGLLLGIVLVFLLSATYFFAKETFFQYVGQKLEKRFIKNRSWRKRLVILGKARESLRQPQETECYLTFPFSVHKAAKDDGDLRDVVRMLSQHHGKLLIVQIMVFIFIATLGLLDGRAAFQIPAGATFLIMMSLGLMVFGAITFWFRRLGMIMVFAPLLLVGWFGSNGSFYQLNPAFGMDYTSGPAEYSVNRLGQLSTQALAERDHIQTIAYLDKWKQQYVAKYHRKPRAVFVTASGGGLRSALWTFHVMQQADSMTNGILTDEIRLMSGASGGMIGLGYFRELLFQQEQKREIYLQDKLYRRNISKDLLNRLFFKKFTGLILPNRTISIDEQYYHKDVGYAFDQQMSTNMPEFYNRRLGDYTQLVQQGRIPPMVLSPTVLNQGRKLYITSTPSSFLARPSHITDQYQSKASGIEFSRMFADQGADDLLMTTALRMNATFPFVLPVVELPSQPVMQVMDAGAIDNYGTQTAVKYLFELREWFLQNTEGVLILQIRDNDRNDPIRDASNQSLLAEMMTPLGGGLYSMAEAKDMSNDYLLEFIREWYEGPVDIVPIEYPRETSRKPASLSWHLTAREKANILSSIETPQNQEALQLLARIYEGPVLASRR